MEAMPRSHRSARSSRRDLVAAAGMEARALARVASLWTTDLGSDVPSLRRGEDVVVLVHGALATAGAWRPLRTRIENEAVAKTAAFSYGPASGVVEIARALSRFVARMPEGVRIHLIGHSLGGLAVRWFVQEMPPDERVVETVSVAAPFEGARGARLLPGRAGRDMQRQSVVLERLRDSAYRSPVPHLSIFGTTDTAVSDETRFPVGDRLVVRNAGHNMLLFHDAVARAILERIAQTRAAATD